ncbi:MAG TPA: CHASE2 domain-containing protein [bacterium]|nr:CHASE2 domain-containing protein [bacterium]
MEKSKGFLRRLFGLSPFKISFLIMGLFLFLYLGKEFSDKFQALQLIELKAYDIRFRALDSLSKVNYIGRFSKPSPSDQVVIVEVDDRALGYLGWPFPRSEWAKFFREMRKYQPAAIGFDIVFDTTGKYVGLQFLEDVSAKYRELNLDSLPEEARGSEGKAVREYFDRSGEFISYVHAKEEDADFDRKMAAELKQSPDVVLGWFGYKQGEEVEELKKQDLSTELDKVKSTSLSVIRSGGIDWPTIVQRMRPVRFYGFTNNIQVLCENAEHFGFFTSDVDILDGTIRWAPLISLVTLDPEHPSEDNSYLLPSLSLASLSVFYDQKPLVNISPLGVQQVMIGDETIPTDQYGRILINWMGPSRTFTYVSIYDILTEFKETALAKDKIDPYKTLKGKIVLVGSTAIGAHDMRTTPFGTMAGIEMHANVVSNILNHNVLIRPPWFTMFDMAFIIGVGILFGLILPRVSAVWGGAVSLGLFLGYIVMDVYFFEVKHYSFTIVFPLAEILFIYLGVTIYRYATEEREKRFIKGAFSHYLSPAVIEQLVKDPSKLNLGGVRKEMTAFFSDIQSFSSFSEKMEPEQLVHFLNIYLTEMCDIVLSYDGTIDKFEGDAIIAFFGAPLDVPDHAAKACLCAAEIQKKMVEYRKEWLAAGWPEVHMRIGLNTGAMVVGNMGSKDRMDYTIMGDAVNLASRLESGAKQYKVYLMISEDTRDEAGDVIEVRELDAIRVKGKEQPVKVFEVLGKKGEVDPKKREAAKLFEKGLEMYRQRYWSQAVEQFKQALELAPNDGPSLTFMDRCEEYSENPPGSGWDGVYTMTSK